jgi:hypothetical protein
MLDIQKSLLKAQAKAAELRLEADARMKQVMGQGLEQRQNANAAGNLPTPYQNAGQPAPSITEILTNAAMASGDPGMIMQMQKASSEMETAGAQQQMQKLLFERMGQGGGGGTEDFSIGPQGVTMDINAPRGSLQTITNPDGSQSMVAINRDTGRPMGHGGLPSSPDYAIPVKPSDRATFLQSIFPTSELDNYMGPNNERPTPGMSGSDIEGNFSFVSTPDQQVIMETQQGLRVLDSFSDVIQRVYEKIPDEETLKQRGAKGVYDYINRYLQQDPDVEIMRKMQPMLVSLARTLATEKGPLTDQDVARITKAFPSQGFLPDRRDVAEGALNNVFDKMYGAIEMRNPKWKGRKQPMTLPMHNSMEEVSDEELLKVLGM